MMKLSEFFKSRKVSFYKDEQGIPKTKVEEPIPEGELVFKNLTLDSMDKFLKSKKLHNIETPQGWNEFVYDILDVLADVEKDVDSKTFCEAMIMPPNSYFEFFKEDINRVFIDMINKYKNKVNSEKKLVNDMTKTMDELPEEIKQDIAKTMEEKNKELNKTDSEKLEDLQVAYENEKDTKKRKVILLEMAKLQEQINRKLEEEKEANQAKILENEQKIKEFDKKKEEEKKDNVINVVPKTEG